MRYQSIYETDADYDRTLEILQLSKEVKFHCQTEKGLLLFSLKSLPEVKLQLSPRGKLNIYHNSFESLHEVLIILKRLFLSEAGKPAQFKLSRIVPSRAELMERLMDGPYDPVRSLNVKFLAPLIENGWIADA